jgi:hypothetical protein
MNTNRNMMTFLDQSGKSFLIADLDVVAGIVIKDGNLRLWFWGKNDADTDGQPPVDVDTSTIAFVQINSNKMTLEEAAKRYGWADDLLILEDVHWNGVTVPAHIWRRIGAKNGD